MIIKKGDNECSVIENQLSWTVKKDVGKLKVEVKIPKDICPTFEELQAYILKNDVIGGKE